MFTRTRFLPSHVFFLAVREGKCTRGMLKRDYASVTADYRKRFHPDSGPLPLFPPPKIESPGAGYKNGLSSSWSTPFITPSAGELPHGPPCCTDELCANYLVGGLSKAAPNIDVDFETQCCATNNEAKRTLARADAEHSTWWAAIHVPTISHPDWWPKQAIPVPGFEHVIVGAHAAGIGMHRDRFIDKGNQPALSAPPGVKEASPAPAERLVSTYLALGRGRKHVVLLPPTEDGTRVANSLGGEGCDEAGGRRESQRARFPLRPPPETLEAVIAAGGYWFAIEAGQDSSPEEEEEEQQEEELIVLEEAPAAAAEAVFATAAAESASRAYGSNVSEASSSSDDNNGEESNEGDEGDEDDEDDEDDDPDPVALFNPAGWYHWLVGDSEFHVAWSGSFFPGTHRNLKGAERSAAEGGKGTRGKGASGKGAARQGGRGGGGDHHQQQQQVKGKPQRGTRAPRWSRGF